MGARYVPRRLPASRVGRAALHSYGEVGGGKGKANQRTKVVIGSDTVGTQAELAENWGASALIEDAVRHDEGRLAKDGPLVVATGKHTGRSAKDKFIEIGRAHV